MAEITEIIRAGFGTGASGDDLNGTAPDTTNTPGNNWVSGANAWEYDGAGKAKANATGNQALIDTAQTDMRVSCTWNAGGADNRLRLLARSDTTGLNAGGDCIHATLIPASATGTVQIVERIAGTSTTLLSVNLSLSTSTTYTLTLVVRGPSAEVFLDGVSQGAAVIGVAAGDETNAGLNHGTFTNGNGRVDDFVVETMPTIDLTGLTETTILHDGFSGGAADIDGQLPDVVDNGNVWDTSGAGDVSRDGSGKMQATALNDIACIEVGVAPEDVYALAVEGKFNSGSADNRGTFFIASLASGTSNKEGVGCGIQTGVGANAFTLRFNNNTNTNMTAFPSITAANNTEHTVKCVYAADGRIDVYFAGNVVEKTFYTPHLARTGAMFRHGVFTNGNGRGDDFRVYQYTAPSSGTWPGYYGGGFF